MKVLALFSLLSAATALHDSYINVESFKGFQVLRASPETPDHIEFIKNLEKKPFYDFWTEVRDGRSVDIMASPEHVQQLQKDLSGKGISFDVMIPDVDALIQLEKVPAKVASERASADHPMTWTEYHSLEDMYAYLDYLEATYDFVSTESVGKSGQGTEMRVAKLCKGACGDKPAIWIDGGIHAREWISPATVTWMLREVVENNDAHPDLLDNLDWYFLPSHNPDGYAYSRSDNRMWRKTRSNHGSIFGCKGVDANRNWGFHWNEGGSSNDKCSDTYHGPEAWSEIENVNVRDFIDARKDKFVFYNSIHSYSQLILLPWSYTSELADNYDYMYELAMKGSDALTAVHGKYYETGCIPCLLYIASGSSADWALGEAGIDFSISMELRDTGRYGFILPPEQIIPTAEEVWAFHITVIREIMAAQ